MMQAMITTAYGSPEVFKLNQVAEPTVKPNEIRVRIKAAAVTKACTMMRTGKPYIGRLFTGLPKPKHRISGTGFAGVVDAVGAEVTRFKVGDSVFGENIASFGTYAQFVRVPEDGVVAHMPDALNYDAAAGMCDGGVTSLNFLKNLGEIKAGQKVLINGASGSLGSAAVQIAKHYGAEVVGVCGPSNVDFVKSLGADSVIDYTKVNFAETGNKYDLIYDTVGVRSFGDCKVALTDSGRYVSPVLGGAILGAMVYTSIFGKKKAMFSATGALPQKEIKRLLEELVDIIEAGHLQGYVDRSYPLQQLADAHKYVDMGHKRGNVVVVPSL